MRIVIVGAGPVGCFTARLLEQAGFHPILLEEHNEVGKPVQCAGIVSTDIIALMRPFISDGAIINTINNFSINTPWQESFSINKDGVAAILNREKFDTCLGEGLEIHLGETVTSIEQNTKGYLLRTAQGKEYETDILIGADGVDSIVREYFLKRNNHKRESRNFELAYYYGLQYQIRLKDSKQQLSPDTVQVFFDDTIPFFIWIVPENEYLLRLGVVADHGKKVLDEFIKEKGIEGKIEEVITGKIPIGFISTSADGIALVGDAACQMKPLTGGGLSFGLRSAQILADCINEGNLDRYDGRWKKQFGPEIRFGIRARKIYENLEEYQRAELFQIFKKNAPFIEQIVDFDTHSGLFREAFQKPSILLDAGKLLRPYLTDLAKEFFK
ncbi:MAG: NAD(P)/FAD-dependent oxidoreductase [Candidatus Atribacteria bacterium]|nr:NAD(P)/FAD-dependent oxidoreductase [Candidatus Atribacteria bacterium]